MLLRRFISCLLLIGFTKGDFDRRLTIINDKQAPVEHRHVRLAFSTSTGRLLCAKWVGSAADKESWSSWTDLGSPTRLFSNPVTVHDKLNRTHVFAQGSDGQVYSLVQQRGKTGCNSFSGWTRVGDTKLPFDGVVLKTITGRDSVSALRAKRGSAVYVFSRTFSKPSRLYVSVFNGEKFTPWESLGGDLVSDVTVVDNAFTQYLEAFGIFADGSIHRIWQWKDRTWSSWRSMSYGQPAFVASSRPVAQAKASNFFNGGLEVFALGKDGMVRHCYQTTCTMVNNAWGLCTWSWWFKIPKKMPSPLSNTNAISVADNIHGGNEIFMIGNDYSVRHLWQTEDGGSWSNWEIIGQVSQHVASLPILDADLWWGVHFEDKDSKILVLKQNRTMVVYPTNVGFGGVVAVGWNVPLDESLERDWVGVFKVDAPNDEYLVYRYVNGGLNPGNKPVPKGKAGMRLFLPKGRYEVRYMVGGQLLSVIQKEIVSNSSSSSTTWMQVYRGLNRGLGEENLEEPDCVDEGEMMVAKFELSFAAFVKKDFHRGLNLLGEAIHEIYKSLMVCGEVKMAYKIMSFAKDLMECSVDFCASLIIDLAQEVYIIYKARHEIYTDIRAAINAFEISAYEQGALNIGRIIRYSLGLPDVNLVKDIFLDNLLGMGLKELNKH